MAERGHDDDTDLLDFIPERLSESEDMTLPPSGGGKLRSLLIATALIGVAIAGAAGWYMLAGGTASDGKVTAPLIPADNEPYKVRPADPGGMQVPNQDKLVYDRLEPSGSERPEVETLLPEPATPSEPPASSAVDAPETVALPKALSDGPMDPPPPPSEDLDAASEAASPATAAPAAPAASEAAPDVTPPRAPTETKAATVAAAPRPSETAAPEVKDTPAETQQPAPAAKQPSMAGGDYMVQLAALRSEEAARTSWGRLQGKYPTLLGALTLVVERADLGDKGVFYRVRATGLDSEAAAKDLCAALAKDKVGCLFVGKR